MCCSTFPSSATRAISNSVRIWHDYAGVGAVPGSSFFREPVNHLIRLHFAKKDETLLEALNRLEGLRTKIKPKK